MNRLPCVLPALAAGVLAVSALSTVAAPPPLVVVEVRAARALAPAAAAVPVAPSDARHDVVTAREPNARPAPRATAAIGGRLADRHAPGLGAAWIVEAYRLTSIRSAVVEQRRGYLAADGRFAIEGLTPGTWQLAVVAPYFAWGPLLDLPSGEVIAGIELPRPGLECVAVAMGPDEAWQFGARVRVELVATRGPALAGAPLRLGRPVASREVRIGDPCEFEGVARGAFEVRVTPCGAADASLERSAAVEVGGAGRTAVRLPPAGGAALAKRLGS